MRSTVRTSSAACAIRPSLAITSSMTQNVAPIPLLWIAPLSIYLLSFILSFESDKIYQRWLFLPLGLVALALAQSGKVEMLNLPSHRRHAEPQGPDRRRWPGGAATLAFAASSRH